MPNRNAANHMPGWGVAALVVLAAAVTATLMWLRKRGTKEGYQANCTNWFAGVINTGQAQLVTLPGNRKVNSKILTLATRTADGNYQTKVLTEANDAFDSYPGGLWHAKVGDVYTLQLEIPKNGLDAWGCYHTNYSTGKPMPGRSKPKFAQVNCAKEPARSSGFCYWYPGSKFYTGPDPREDKAPRK